MRRWLIWLALVCASAACDSDGDGGEAVIEDAETRPDMTRVLHDATVDDMMVVDEGLMPDEGVETDGVAPDMGPRTACADGLDNDRDGRVDFPDDPGCEDAADDDEADPVPVAQCADLEDNDGDGRIDLADPDCANAGDATEGGANPASVCANGQDDDDDGLIDFPFDPGCPAAGHNSEVDPSPAAECSNGVDDDGDGNIDFPADPGCAGAGDETEAATDPVAACANGADDDGSGAADWPDDPGCDGAGDLTEISPCGPGAPVIDLNRHLAQNEAFDGDLNGAPANLVAECGGAAGGEMIFLYRVERALDRLVFSTRHVETQAPVVMYLRDRCQGADIACDRGLAANPGVVLNIERPVLGTYFLVVDTGSRMNVGRFRLTVDAVAPPQCRDEIDNDEDGRVDLGDPGCEETEDPDETDPPEPPVCANGIDDDMDGLVDWPQDPDCEAAGAPEESPPCALDIPFIRVGQAGGEFELDPLQGAGSAQGTCQPGLGAETVVVLTLTEPSDVLFQVLVGAGVPAQVTLHARSDCADPMSEIGCRSSMNHMEDLELLTLDRGTHFLFAEQGLVPPPQPLTARILVDSILGECNDEVDNDLDERIDLADPGCTDGRDDSERDPPTPPQCSDGIDNDENGVIDWPDDEGCVAAGDPVEDPPGVPLGPTVGFGHHGSCNTFNACGDARTCANAACALNGHGAALSFEEGLCQDVARQVPGLRCHLFRRLPNDLDQNWNNGCNIPVAYDVVCSPR